MVKMVINKKCFNFEMENIQTGRLDPILRLPKFKYTFNKGQRSRRVKSV